MLPCFLSINIDLSLLVDSLKMELYNFGFWGAKLLSIFALAARIPATTSSSGTCRRIGSLVDIPVMGQIDVNGFPIAGKLPTTIEQRLRLGICTIPCT